MFLASVLISTTSGRKQNRHLWSVLPLFPPFLTLPIAGSSCSSCSSPTQLQAIHGQGWSREQQQEWKEEEGRGRQQRDRQGGGGGGYRRWLLETGHSEVRSCRAFPRPATWDDHNTNMWGSPAGPRAAGRHLHEAAPVLARLSETGTLGCRCHFRSFPPICLSLSLHVTATLYHTDNPTETRAFIMPLSMRSDQSVCRGTRLTDLATLPPKPLAPVPHLPPTCFFVSFSPDLCAVLLVEPLPPGPHGGFPEVIVWCASVGRRGGGVSSADSIGTATHMTSRSQFQLPAFTDSHAASWCKQHSLHKHSVNIPARLGRNTKLYLVRL